MNPLGRENFLCVMRDNQKVYIDEKTNDEYVEEKIYSWEGYPLKDPIVHLVKKQKSIEEKINEYLDKKGISNPEIREGLIQLIKEHES